MIIPEEILEMQVGTRRPLLQTHPGQEVAFEMRLDNGGVEDDS